MPLQLGPAKTEQQEKEHRWLPHFAPLLPLPISVPVAKGEPGLGFPGAWIVCTWIEGADAKLERLGDPVQAATQLAEFIRALQRIDPADGPAPGDHNFMRGVSLAWRDPWTRDAITRCEGLIDTDAVTSAWETDLNAPAWDRPGVWLHGDLAPGNLVARDGRLAGVIDWGGLGVGDPATELIPAWNLFVGESREAYRAALGVDDATWRRGRGHALSQALMALPYYLHTNPEIVRWARHMIREVLADHERGE
jgi:aminoglycoside phosphotransferase (APT) family kinase protein